MSNCTGHCCDNFYTQYSPTEWARYRRAALRNQKTFSLDNGNRKNVSSNKRDIVYIAEMLILKGSINGSVNVNTGLNEGFKYTCRHFDNVSRRCKNYEARPKMCSGYPENTDRKCTIKGCTYYQ